MTVPLSAAGNRPAGSTLPRRLVITNLLMGCSGAAVLGVLLYGHGTAMLAAVILWSIFILQFYRTILLLAFTGVEGAWAGMRKWRVKHWTHTPAPNQDT